MCRNNTSVLTFVTVVTLVAINPVHNQSNDLYYRMSGVVKLEKNHPIRVCHDELLKTLSHLCIHGYNKRSFFNENENDEMPRPALTQGSSNGLDNVLTNMLVRNPQRFHRNVRNSHSECCERSCTIEKLLTYCRDAPTTERPRFTVDNTSE